MGRAPARARAGLRITRAASPVLVLLAILAVHAGNAHAQVHAFLWTATDGMLDLGSLGGTFSQAGAVNTSRQVVGSSYAGAGPFSHHAFLWTAADGMVDLGTLGGNISQAFAVNTS